MLVCCMMKYLETDFILRTAPSASVETSNLCLSRTFSNQNLISKWYYWKKHQKGKHLDKIPKRYKSNKLEYICITEINQ